MVKNLPRSRDSCEDCDPLKLFRHIEMARVLLDPEEITFLYFILYFNNRSRRNGVFGR